MEEDGTWFGFDVLEFLEVAHTFPPVHFLVDYLVSYGDVLVHAIIL